MKLALHDWGDAGSPALVCLHGVTSYGGHFRKLAEEHLASHFHVLAPDLRGHGRSGQEPPWDLATHVDDVLETVGEEPRLWLGHSFGGRLVIELMAARPELVDRAVLLDPAIRSRPDASLLLAETARTDQSVPTLTQATRFHTPQELVDEELRENVVDGRYRWCKSAVVSIFGELCRRPPPYELLRAPTLIVLGADESVVGPHRLRVFAEGLGDRLEIVKVPGGHTVLWDAFQETADAVEQFLLA